MQYTNNFEYVIKAKKFNLEEQNNKKNIHYIYIYIFVKSKVQYKELP
jgi:hypothetical protein